MSRTKSRIAALIVVGVFAQGVFAQDLAGVAKKEQQRRKVAPAPAKTYTETDLASAHVDSPPSSSSSSAGEGTPLSPSPVAPGAVASSESGAEGGETYWRGRFRGARQKIVAAEAEVTRLERVGTRLRATPGNVEMRDCSEQRAKAKPGDRIRVRNCAPTGETLQTEMDQARHAVTLARQALVDLESEARRRGALPAWVR